MTGELLPYALAADRAGLCVVPPRQNGSKAPEGFWRDWQTQRPDQHTLRSWYGNGRTGIGYVCGAVSGNLEMLEFETQTIYDQFVATAEALGLAELVETVSAGYETETPGGGIHWLYRSSEIAGNTKLACRPKRPEEKQHERDNVAVLIETRGQGGYTVEAPSHGGVHPSGGAYLLVRGGVDTIATISADERQQLWDLARSFDQLPASMPNADPMAGGRPVTSSLIDDFNARTSWRELLIPDGWTLEHERGGVCYWRRPGKDRGVSAISGYSPDDRLAVYSTSTELESGRGHSKFAYMALHQHGGDFKAAVRSLAEQSPVHTLRQPSNVEPTPDETAAPAQAGSEKEERETVADVLIRLGSAGDLFCDRLGETYARVMVGEHRECWPLRSRGFRRWLTHAYYVEREKAPGGDALSAALGVLEAKAQFDAPAADVYVRVAPDGDGGLYIDLGDASWQAAHVTSAGWQIVAEPAVRFRRSGGMQALPLPERGGSLDELRPLVNVKTDADWSMVKGWMRAAMRDRGPFPIMAIVGEQGSAKSTFGRILRAVTDPARPDLRSEPREQRDLAIAARGCWVIAFDNVSSLQPWLSDGLCRLATGGGWATRELYSDLDEVLFDAQRPIILTGIGGYLTRGDVLERCVSVNLEEIPKSRRRPEHELWAEIEAILPRILGALLDDLAGALRALPATKIPELPRMADFALWAVAAERGRGEVPTFIDAYANAEADTYEQAVDASPISGALRKFLDELPEMGWQESPAEFLAALEALATDKAKRSKGWPSTPRKLTSELQRLTPSLRNQGYLIVTGKRAGGGKRLISVSRTAPEMFAAEPSQPTPPSQTIALPDRNDPAEGVSVRIVAPEPTDTTVTPAEIVDEVM